MQKRMAYWSVFPWKYILLTRPRESKLDQPPREGSSQSRTENTFSSHADFANSELKRVYSDINIYLGTILQSIVSGMVPKYYE